VSLPAIQRGLGFSSQDLQWVITAQALTFGGFLMVGGRCADLFDRRLLLRIGIVVFLAGSVWCSLAHTEVELIAGRATQGLGGAIALPTALAVLTSTFPTGPIRNRALGTWWAVGAVGAISGNIIGGVLTSVAGWRWIFLVNVPVCAGVLVGSRLFMAKDGPRSREGRRIDAPGALTVTAGLALLIFAMGRIAIHGFAEPLALAALSLSAVLLLGFVAIESRVRDPLVPLGLFRRRGAVGYVLVLTAASVVPAPYYFTSLYLQHILGFSALVAGFAFAPWAVMIAFSAFFAGRKAARVGAWRLATAGFGLAAFALLLLSSISVSTRYAGGLLPSFIVMGLAGGMIGLSGPIVALADVPGPSHGTAAALVNSSQQIGRAVSTGALVAIAVAHTRSLAASGVAQQAAEVSGYRVALLTTAGVAALGAVFAATVVRRRTAPAIDAASKAEALSELGS
jgi:MFS family permease